MIRPGDEQEATRFQKKLEHFDAEIEPLGGLSVRSLEVFVAQLIESFRRVRYRHTLRSTNYQVDSVSPHAYFDPLKAAVVRNREGDFDEACWLVFLSVHFGYHRNHRWTLSGAFYTRLAQGAKWTWAEASRDIDALLDWLETNEKQLRSLDAKFGNHRKYESFDARSNNGTGAVIASYIDWASDSHIQRISKTGSPSDRFAELFMSLDNVRRFGRTARFDYLTLLGDLGIADIVADSMHLSGATGPRRGAQLLLTGSTDPRLAPIELESRLLPLRDLLEIPFNVLEDALCNWQKSPNQFKPFRG